MILSPYIFFDIFLIMKNAKFEFILIGIVAMCIYLSLEAINIGRTLTMLGEKSTFLKNFKYAAIGFFFSAVTPAASGGHVCGRVCGAVSALQAHGPPPDLGAERL